MQVDIRCVNWFELDDSLKQDWCMNINSNNMRYDADTTKSDEEYLYDTIDSMYKHANKIEDLESALNTSRYFIFLSGMCGFVLGLACLYFVV